MLAANIAKRTTLKTTVTLGRLFAGRRDNRLTEMVARRHHYVPLCYLKAFSVEQKKDKWQVQVFDKKERKTYRTATENVALERDFNTVEAEGLEPDVFEKAAAKFEDELAPALERIIAAQSLQQDADDYAILLNFVTLLALRNPRQRETVRDFHERVAKQIMNVALSTPERWAHQVKKATVGGFLKTDADASYATMKKFVEDGEFSFAVSNERQISLEASTFDKLLPLIFRRGWVLLKAPRDSGGFITSDHPVCLTTVGGKPGIAHRPGYGLRNTEVLFSISSKLAMVGAFEIDDGEAEVDENMVASFNGVVAAFRGASGLCTRLSVPLHVPGRRAIQKSVKAHN
jgi:hypothetical protein